MPDDMELVSIFNVAYTQNTNFLTTDITPISPPNKFSAYVCLDTAGVFSIQRTYAAVTKVEKLNDGQNIDASCGFWFDFIVSKGESVNFQSTGANGNILKFSIVEARGI